MERTLGLCLKRQEGVSKGTNWEENSRYWTGVSKESGVAETYGAGEGGGRVEAGEVQDLGLHQEGRGGSRFRKPTCRKVNGKRTRLAAGRPVEGGSSPCHPGKD